MARRMRFFRSPLGGEGSFGLSWERFEAPKHKAHNVSENTSFREPHRKLWEIIKKRKQRKVGFAAR